MSDSESDPSPYHPISITGGATQGHRIVRDPVYGMVSIPKELFAVIDTPPVQRLRFIALPGAAVSRVFLGGDHSVFSHAIGSSFLGARVLDTVAAASRTYHRDAVVERAKLSVSKMRIASAAAAAAIPSAASVAGDSCFAPHPAEEFDVPSDPAGWYDALDRIVQVAVLLRHVGTPPLIGDRWWRALLPTLTSSGSFMPSSAVPISVSRSLAAGGGVSEGLSASRALGPTACSRNRTTSGGTAHRTPCATTADVSCLIARRMAFQPTAAGAFLRPLLPFVLSLIRGDDAEAEQLGLPRWMYQIVNDRLVPLDVSCIDRVARDGYAMARPGSVDPLLFVSYALTPDPMGPLVWQRKASVGVLDFLMTRYSRQRTIDAHPKVRAIRAMLTSALIAAAEPLRIREMVLEMAGGGLVDGSRERRRDGCDDDAEEAHVHIEAHRQGNRERVEHVGGDGVDGADGGGDGADDDPGENVIVGEAMPPSRSSQAPPLSRQPSAAACADGACQTRSAHAEGEQISASGPVAARASLATPQSPRAPVHVPSVGESGRGSSSSATHSMPDSAVLPDCLSIRTAVPLTATQASAVDLFLSYTDSLFEHLLRHAPMQRPQPSSCDATCANVSYVPKSISQRPAESFPTLRPNLRIYPYINAVSASPSGSSGLAAAGQLIMRIVCRQLYRLVETMALEVDAPAVPTPRDLVAAWRDARAAACCTLSQSPAAPSVASPAAAPAEPLSASHSDGPLVVGGLSSTNDVSRRRDRVGHLLVGPTSGVGRRSSSQGRNCANTSAAVTEVLREDDIAIVDEVTYYGSGIL